MKLNYNYDEDGFFVGISEARIDVMGTRFYGKTKYLSPRNSTHTPIPNDPLPEGMRWKWEGEWLMVEEPKDDALSEDLTEDIYD